LVAVFAEWGVTSRPLSLLVQLNGSTVCSNCTAAHDFEALQDTIAECSAREELLKAEAKDHYKTASFFMCGAAFFVACATSGGWSQEGFAPHAARGWLATGGALDCGRQSVPFLRVFILLEGSHVRTSSSRAPASTDGACAAAP